MTGSILRKVFFCVGLLSYGTSSYGVTSVLNSIFFNSLLIGTFVNPAASVIEPVPSAYSADQNIIETPTQIRTIQQNLVAIRFETFEPSEETKNRKIADTIKFKHDVSLYPKHGKDIVQTTLKSHYLVRLDKIARDICIEEYSWKVYPPDNPKQLCTKSRSSFVPNSQYEMTISSKQTTGQLIKNKLIIEKNDKIIFTGKFDKTLGHEFIHTQSGTLFYVIISDGDSSSINPGDYLDANHIKDRFNGKFKPRGGGRYKTSINGSSSVKIED